MIYALPITLKKAQQIEELDSNKRDYVTFAVDNNGERVLFFLAHGTSEGKISLRKADVTLEQLAYGIVNKIKAIDSTVKTVYTISCYGGLQTGCVVDGITFKSMHDSKEEIYTSVWYGDEGKCALDVFVN